MNDADLLSFGSAQLVIVARLIAWRGVRAETSRFGVSRRHRSFCRKLMRFLLWGGGDMGISLFPFTITVEVGGIPNLHRRNPPVLPHRRSATCQRPRQEEAC